MEAAEELDTLQHIAHTLLDRQALLCEGLPWKNLPCTQRLLDTHHKLTSSLTRTFPAHPVSRDLDKVDRLGLETFALRARMLHKELRPLYGLIQDMRRLADAVLLLFCRLNHQALGMYDAQSLNMTGWLELLSTTVKVMLFAQRMPAPLIVQLFTLASCLGQNKDPPHLEQIREFVASFSQPAAWLQSRFSGVSAVIGQLLKHAVLPALQAHALQESSPFCGVLSHLQAQASLCKADHSGPSQSGASIAAMRSWQHICTGALLGFLTCPGELLRLEALPEVAWLLGQHPRLAVHSSHTCDMRALYAAHVQPCLQALLQLRGRRERTDVILKAQALIPGAQEQAAGHATRLQLCRQLTQTLEDCASAAERNCALCGAWAPHFLAMLALGQAQLEAHLALAQQAAPSLKDRLQLWSAPSPPTDLSVPRLLAAMQRTFLLLQAHREGIQQHQLQRFQAAIEQLQIAPGGTIAHALPSPTAAEQPTNSPVQASLPHAEPQKLQTLGAMKAGLSDAISVEARADSVAAQLQGAAPLLRSLQTSTHRRPRDAPSRSVLGKAAAPENSQQHHADGVPIDQALQAHADADGRAGPGPSALADSPADGLAGALPTDQAMQQVDNKGAPPAAADAAGLTEQHAAPSSGGISCSQAEGDPALGAVHSLPTSPGVPIPQPAGPQQPHTPASPTGKPQSAALLGSAVPLSQTPAAASPLPESAVSLELSMAAGNAAAPSPDPMAPPAAVPASQASAAPMPADADSPLDAAPVRQAAAAAPLDVSEVQDTPAAESCSGDAEAAVGATMSSPALITFSPLPMGMLGTRLPEQAPDAAMPSPPAELQQMPATGNEIPEQQADETERSAAHAAAEDLPCSGPLDHHSSSSAQDSTLPAGTLYADAGTPPASVQPDTASVQDAGSPVVQLPVQSSAPAMQPASPGGQAAEVVDGCNELNSPGPEDQYCSVPTGTPSPLRMPAAAAAAAAAAAVPVSDGLASGAEASQQETATAEPVEVETSLHDRHAPQGSACGAGQPAPGAAGLLGRQRAPAVQLSKDASKASRSFVSVNCSSAPENTPLGEGRAWLDHWMAPQPPQDAGLAELTLKAAHLLPLLQGGEDQAEALLQAFAQVQRAWRAACISLVQATTIAGLQPQAVLLMRLGKALRAAALAAGFQAALTAAVPAQRLLTFEQPLRQAMAQTALPSPESLSLAAVWGFPIACLGSCPEATRAHKQAALNLWDIQMGQLERVFCGLLREQAQEHGGQTAASLVPPGVSRTGTDEPRAKETQNPTAQPAVPKVQAAKLAAHAEVPATATISAAPKPVIAEANQQPAGRQGMRHRVAAKLRHYGRAVAAVRPVQKGPTGAVSQAGYDAQVAPRTQPIEQAAQQPQHPPPAQDAMHKHQQHDQQQQQQRPQPRLQSLKSSLAQQLHRSRAAAQSATKALKEAALPTPSPAAAHDCYEELRCLTAALLTAPAFTVGTIHVSPQALLLAMVQWATASIISSSCIIGKELQHPQVLLARCQNLRAALAMLEPPGSSGLVAAADTALQAAATWQLGSLAPRGGLRQGSNTSCQLLEVVGEWFADRLLLDGGGRGVGFSEARATFFGMPANENSPDPASFASLGELAALLEVFGLPVAHELARRSAKPLQAAMVSLDGILAAQSPILKDMLTQAQAAQVSPASAKQAAAGLPQLQSVPQQLAILARCLVFRQLLSKAVARRTAAHAGQANPSSALVLPNGNEPPAEAALAAAGLPAPHGPQQADLAHDMADPALMAAVSGKVQRWQSWPVLLGLALQEPVWRYAQYDPTRAALSSGLDCFAVCARALAVGVPAASFSAAGRSGADAGPAWAALKPLGHGLAMVVGQSTAISVSALPAKSSGWGPASLQHQPEAHIHALPAKKPEGLARTTSMAPAMGVQQAMGCLLAVASASMAACDKQVGDRALVVDGLRNAGLAAQQLETAGFYGAQAEALHHFACTTACEAS